MRIGIISLIHESNTFILAPMTLELFRREALFVGDQIVARYEPWHHEVSGFIKGVRAGGAQLVPIFAAWGMPSGPVTNETYDTLLCTMMDELDRALPLDGLLLAPHGAGVSQEHPDMDGHWLTLVRQKVGPQVPIVCTIDPHANVSQRMIEACNATIAYRTNPHLDQRQIGQQAASLLIRTIQGQVKPTQAACFPPIAINIEQQETAIEPCKSMYEVANRMLERPGVLSNSIVLGFAYSDVKEMGSSFIAVTDNDPPLARQLVDELAAYLYEHRQDFVARLIGIDEALDMATATGERVCLLDMGDNVGGGSVADGTFIAHALHERRTPGAFVALNDPESVRQAAAAGVGHKVQLSVGGKTDDLHGPPLAATFTVRGIYEGKLTEPKPRHGGRIAFDMGQTAIVETEHDLTIQLTSVRTGPASLNQLRCCQLDPASFHILVAKGVVAPVAAYEEVCTKMIRVNTRGTTTADLDSFTYHHRRRPLFPFEPILPRENWQDAAAVGPMLGR